MLVLSAASSRHLQKRVSSCETVFKPVILAIVVVCSTAWSDESDESFLSRGFILALWSSHAGSERTRLELRSDSIAFICALADFSAVL